MNEEKNDTSCRECKYIFYFSFAALLSLFFLTYFLRGPDQVAAGMATTTPSQASTTHHLHNSSSRAVKSL